jgi:hypothetical protein
MLNNRAHHAGAAVMAEAARQTTLPRPAAIAIHDDGHMLWKRWIGVMPVDLGIVQDRPLRLDALQEGPRF